MERGVRGDDADERDAWEVEALRDHLGADEDVDLLALEGRERLLVVLAAAHRVGVHAPDAGLRERLGELRLDALAAHAEEAQARARAARALLGNAPLLAARVAHEPVDLAVVGEADVALLAREALLAAGAPQDRDVAAAVQEQDRLLLRLERLLEVRAQEA